ncbi:MAG: indole-3-glycerol phosphate synthase TrpC [Sphingobacteriales bacterium]|jgi:indole-3-glycerol phosphate synthase|nr:indole-3-glycerol phosphate synthase TrpC [Sphingobacteriales bacterium]
MNILDIIVAHKLKEIERRKKQTSILELEKRSNFSIPVRSLSASLNSADGLGIIAEFKRKSPSMGFIKQDADVAKITDAYTSYGAACLSILTDIDFFGGSDQDLLTARENDIPILRKDFVVDEYQLVEAKSLGADVILLIAACLTPEQVKKLSFMAASLGLEVILELHSEDELVHICDKVKIVGVNNRDLKTFKVDIKRSLKMAEKIPNDKIKIAESGINAVDDILIFRNNGFKGFLVGEHFMKQSDTGLYFKNFVEELKSRI